MPPASSGASEHLVHYGIILREERYLERKFGKGYFSTNLVGTLQTGLREDIDGRPRRLSGAQQTRFLCLSGLFAIPYNS
jgi:hypothetical protein